MEFEIIEQPRRFHLYGVRGDVPNEQYGQTGLRLMNQMWPIVKSSHTLTTGINHWAYLPRNQMFVGVELQPSQTAPPNLEPLQFEMTRYLKHLHVGPYQELPQKWQRLQAELKSRGESIDAPSLEIYGHHCEDPAKLETTILIRLKDPSAAAPENST